MVCQTSLLLTDCRCATEREKGEREMEMVYADWQEQFDNNIDLVDCSEWIQIPVYQLIPRIVST